MPDPLAEDHSGGAFDRALQPGISMVNFEVARLPGTLASRVGTAERSVAPRGGGRRACIDLAGKLIEPVESGGSCAYNIAPGAHSPGA